VTQPFIGEIRIFSFNFVPKNWAMCNGQLLAINTNQALFSILGTTYGGNGIQTFALPDFRGRAGVNTGVSPISSATYTLGQVAGTETVTLNTTTIPLHTHTVTAQTGLGTGQKPPAHYISQAASGSPAFSPTITNGQLLAPQSIGAYGGGQAHANLQPYLVLTYGIAMFGIYPSRN
jgi:microcystin-dependent protein